MASPPTRGRIRRLSLALLDRVNPATTLAEVMAVACVSTAILQ
jgi:hypothetical protein